MFSTFALNDNNDIYIGQDGNLAMLTDLAAVQQTAVNAVRTLLGEMVLQTDQGIPYKTTAWNGTPNLIRFNAALSATLLACPGVVEVLQLNSYVQNNTLFYAAIFSTVFGSGSEGIVTNVNAI